MFRFLSVTCLVLQEWNRKNYKLQMLYVFVSFGDNSCMQVPDMLSPFVFFINCHFITCSCLNNPPLFHFLHMVFLYCPFFYPEWHIPILIIGPRITKLNERINFPGAYLSLSEMFSSVFPIFYDLCYLFLLFQHFLSLNIVFNSGN